ncbi:MAG: amino acid permease [Pseudomonadota bacterium]
MKTTSARLTNPDDSSRLVKGLGLLDSTALVMGSMIGSGVFIVSADVAKLLPNPALILACWALAGLVTVFAAVTYGELAGAMPKAGGQYVYLREAYGPLTGFLYGWTLFLVIQSGTIAAVAVAFARYLDVFIPLGRVFFSTDLHLGALTYTLSLDAKQLVALTCIAGLSWLNCRGIRTGALIQNLFTAAKLAALFLLVLAAFTIGAGTWAHFQSPSSGQGLTAAAAAAFSATPGARNALAWPVAGWLGFAMVVGVAMVGPLFSYDAWNNLTFTGAEVRNPRRNLPLALFLGTLLTTLVYLAANLAYFYVLPLSEAAASERIAAAAAVRILGSAGTYFISAAILASTFGCLNGLILAGPRVYYAMAQDGLFFPRMARLNKRGAPKTSVMVQAVWASLLALSGTYSQLLTYIISAALFFYVLTVCSPFVFRRRGRSLGRSGTIFRLAPLLYTATALGIMAANLVLDPRSSWPGFLIIVLGLPAYFAWRKAL